MKVAKVLRKVFIAVLVAMAFLICVGKLRNFKKFLNFKNVLESKKAELAMMSQYSDSRKKMFPGRKYITIR